MTLRRAVPLSVCLALSLLLAGCGSKALKIAELITGASSQSSGSVHGGQQPIVGATIQLYTVGTTADGSAATPLLTSTVTSDATGSFTITGLYSCTNATQVYIIATGGNPGLSTPNPNIALMAALGPCSALTPSTFISINELTTVAAVAALAPFMSSATAIGESQFHPPILANAFTLANQLVDTTTGTSPGVNVPTGYTVPTTELNTLADILSACINSTGGTAGDGSLCGRLFSFTTVSPSPSPTDTITAMLNIANNATLNTPALYALTPPTPPFQPTLTSAPASFAVSLQSLSPIQASPSSLNFQDVTVSSISPIQTITFSNTAGMDRVSLVGPNSSDFIFGNFTSTSGGSCGYGGSFSDPCWIQVKAFPSATGVRNASLAIDFNSGYSTVYIPLSVTGIASNPGSTLSNSFVNFPPTVTGTSATSVPVTLTNSGPGTLTVSAVTVSGVANNNFTQTNNCSSVAVDANCIIFITFAPTTTGTQSATLQITSTATGSNTVSLSGTGVSLGDPPTLWPGSLNFSIWGANEDLILTNSGTSSISTSSVGVATTGGLGQDHAYSATNNCGTTVASGASCTFTIANIPVHPLSFYTTGFSGVTGEAYVFGTSLTSQILTGSSAYLAQNGTFGAGGITFPAQQIGQSETATIQLAGTSSGSPAASLAIGGANPGDFAVSAVQPTVSSTPSSSCPAASTGTQPCTITVTFTPTAAGTRTAKISLDANGSSTGQYIYVTATGVGPGPSFRADQTSISMHSYAPTVPDRFGLGGALINLTNTGTTTATIQPSFTGTDASYMSVSSNNCSSVAPQGQCSVYIGFSAPAAGNYSANLVLSDTSSTFSLTIPLAASTTWWPIATPQTSLSFGNQAVNTTSYQQTFLLGDTNQAPLGHAVSISLQPGTNFTLPVGSSCPASTTTICQLSVAFAPHVAGTVTETLTATDEVTGLFTTISLSGTGTDTPSYTLSPIGFAFPSVSINTSSAPQSITLTSDGAETLTVSGISISGAVNNNFTQTNNCSSVPVGSTCTISVTFAPTSTGFQSANLQITSNATNATTTVGLTATATP